MCKLYRTYFFALILLTKNIRSQTANYVSNGGFEDYYIEIAFPKPFHWTSTDSSKYFGELLTTPLKVPSSSYAFQYPRHGLNYLITSPYSYNNQSNVRGYPRNLLKKTLTSGRVYCVSFFVNLSNQSTHAIDGIGAYFGDISIDTITQCNKPITYLTPQISNISGNIISDTLNWIPVTGTFVANGSEKYMLIGNFKSDVATTKIQVNPTNLPANFADYLIDDVSVMEIDLQAYAGPDKSIPPGDSAFIGRQPDVGIDEACIWYKMTSPTTSISIDTVAGLWVKPVTTTTYVVRQQLWCANTPKWDTVVVFMNLVGIGEELRIINEQLLLYPLPVQDFLQLKIPNEEWMRDFKTLSIYDHLGREMLQSDCSFKAKTETVNIRELPNGIYFLELKSLNGQKIRKRFVVNR